MALGRSSGTCCPLSVVDSIFVFANHRFLIWQNRAQRLFESSIPRQLYYFQEWKNSSALQQNISRRNCNGGRLQICFVHPQTASFRNRSSSERCNNKTASQQDQPTSNVYAAGLSPWYSISQRCELPLSLNVVTLWIMRCERLVLIRLL